jgi:hypothetical protein
LHIGARTDPDAPARSFASTPGTPGTFQWRTEIDFSGVDALQISQKRPKDGGIVSMTFVQTRCYRQIRTAKKRPNCCFHGGLIEVVGS